MRTDNIVWLAEIDKQARNKFRGFPVDVWLGPCDDWDATFKAIREAHWICTDIAVCLSNGVNLPTTVRTLELHGLETLPSLLDCVDLCTLDLKDCEKPVHPSAPWQCTDLKTVRLASMSWIQEMNDLLPPHCMENIQTLAVRNCIQLCGLGVTPKLRSLTVVDVDALDHIELSCMPCLEQITIRRLPSLQSLDFSASLTLRKVSICAVPLSGVVDFSGLCHLQEVRLYDLGHVSSVTIPLSDSNQWKRFVVENLPALTQLQVPKRSYSWYLEHTPLLDQAQVDTLLCGLLQVLHVCRCRVLRRLLLGPNLLDLVVDELHDTGVGRNHRSHKATAAIHA